jgi:hypothetical protein
VTARQRLYYLSSYKLASPATTLATLSRILDLAAIKGGGEQATTIPFQPRLIFFGEHCRRTTCFFIHISIRSLRGKSLAHLLERSPAPPNTRFGVKAPTSARVTTLPLAFAFVRCLRGSAKSEHFEIHFGPFFQYYSSIF